MAVPLLGRFYFLAGGEPDAGDDGRRVLRHFPRMRAFAILPPEFASSEKNPLTAAPESWDFPLDVRPCLKLVLDIARKLGRTVEVVDVNRPGKNREVAERWMARDPVLPLLVSPRGTTLEGFDEFTPKTVRQFLETG